MPVVGENDDVASRTDRSDRLLGDFRILGELGRGGMGIVYEAEQMSMGRRVALKVLPFASTLDKQQLNRFKNEARAAGTLDHPNIVSVFSVGIERGVHYYVMQLIDGQSLADVMAGLRKQLGIGGQEPESGEGNAVDESEIDDPPNSEPVTSPTVDTECEVQAPIIAIARFDTEEYYRGVAQLGIQAAEALNHAHQNGIVHRDVKPGNLLINADGKLWVTDFGLARIEAAAGMTITGQLLGTLRYMSPEQALAKRAVVDHRTDIYSLGATLYELLALRPTYSGRNRQELLNQIALEDPQRLRRLNTRIPMDLETIVAKAMEKSPADRYRAAQDLADDLGRFLNDETIDAKPSTVRKRIVKWSRRHVGIVMATSVTILIALVALSVSMFFLRSAYDAEARQRQIAEREVDRSQKARERAESNMRMALASVANLRADMNDYQIYLRPEGAPAKKLTLVQKPVWTQDVRDATPQVGAAYLWVNRGRPEVVGVDFTYLDGNELKTRHELHSLSHHRLTASYREVPIWRPARGGIELEPIADAPRPGNSAEDRLGEMRSLAKQFTAWVDGEDSSHQLALTPEPLFHYTSVGGDSLDGALFAFLQVSDPEVLLVIEAMRHVSQTKWHYAFAALTERNAGAQHNGEAVWKSPAYLHIAWGESLLSRPDVQEQIHVNYPPIFASITDPLRNLATNSERLSTTLEALGRRQEADAALQRAIEYHRRLAKELPSDD